LLLLNFKEKLWLTKNKVETRLILKVLKLHRCIQTFIEISTKPLCCMFLPTCPH